MKNKNTIAMVLLVAGAILLLASLTADVIGIGDGVGFGYKQISGIVGGVIAAVVGIYMKRKA